MATIYQLEVQDNGDIDLVSVDDDGDRVAVTLSNSPEIRKNEPELAKVFDHLKKRLGDVDGAISARRLDKKLRRLAELEAREAARGK